MHFRTKHRISKLCKQAPSNEQKKSTCNRVNTHINPQNPKCFSFQVTHVQSCSHSLNGIYMPNILRPYCILLLFLLLMFKKVRDCTPTQGNWIVAWSWSVRMLHQGTCMTVNLWCNCKKQKYQVFHPISDLQHKHNQCECWSIMKGERHSSNQYKTFDSLLTICTIWLNTCETGTYS